MPGAIWILRGEKPSKSFLPGRVSHRNTSFIEGDQGFPRRVSVRVAVGNLRPPAIRALELAEAGDSRTDLSFCGAGPDQPEDAEGGIFRIDRLGLQKPGPGTFGSRCRFLAKFHGHVILHGSHGKGRG